MTKIFTLLMNDNSRSFHVHSESQ